jgi:hypothetical protein
MNHFLSRVGLVGFVLQVGLMVGCAESVTLANSSKVPGARGKIGIERTDNKNTHLEVDVEHLAKPDQVDSRAVTYVVWVQALDHATPPQSVGNMLVNDELKGHISTVSPLVAFDLVITPEASQQASMPTGDPVFTARISKPD